MLLLWMAYTLLLGVILYGAGMVAERIAATWNVAHRAVWIGAIVLAVVLPVVLAARSKAIVTPIAASPSTATGSADVDLTIIAPAARRTSGWHVMRSSAERAIAAAEPYAIRVWLGLSVVCLGFLIRSAIGVRRRRVHWRAAELDGVCVRVAPNTGPAVVGILAPSIVIPQWSLGLDATARRLMLLHEAEHVRARDPLVLFAAAIVTALFPWNAALWLLVQRLRLAIEIDCDRRVIAATAAPHEYGLLLITVGARRSSALPFAASLAERRPLLERRIKAMTKTTPKHPRLVSMTCVALLVVAATAAVRAPRPNSLVISRTQSLVTTMPPSSRVAPSPTLEDSARPAMLPVSPTAPLVNQAKAAPAAISASSRGPDSLMLDEVRSMIAAHHPSALTGDPNITTISLVVDTRMNYVTSLTESRELRLYVTEMARGRGRSGGAGPVVAGGGSPGARARGSVGGDNTPPDSATLARLAELKSRMGDSPSLRGDTVILVGDVFMHRGDAAERSSDPTPPTAAELKRVGDMLGMNMTALSTLVGLENVDSIRGRTYKAGELGATPLRIFVVRLIP